MWKRREFEGPLRFSDAIGFLNANLIKPENIKFFDCTGKGLWQTLVILYYERDINN